MDIIEHGRTHYGGKLIFMCRCGCLFSAETNEVEKKTVNDKYIIYSTNCPECGSEVVEQPQYCDITAYRYSYQHIEAVKFDLQRL